MTTAADWQPIIQAIIAALAAIIVAISGLIGTLIVMFARRGIAAMEKRTGIMMTEQDRAAIMGAVTTDVGLIQTKLDLGLMRPTEVLPSSAPMLRAAAQLLDRVPDAATREATTVDTVAAMIAARVDTTPRSVAAPVPLAAGT